MLQNAYCLAKIGADTAENEQHFAEVLPKTGNYPTGRWGVVVRRSLAADAGLVLAAAPAAGAGVVRLGSAHCTLHTATESGENVLKLKTKFGCVYLLQY